MTHLTPEEQLRLHGYVTPATAAELIDTSAAHDKFVQAVDAVLDSLRDDPELFDDLRAALKGQPGSPALTRRVNAHGRRLTAAKLVLGKLLLT